MYEELKKQIWDNSIDYVDDQAALNVDALDDVCIDYLAREGLNYSANRVFVPELDLAYLIRAREYSTDKSLPTALPSDERKDQRLKRMRYCLLRFENGLENLSSFRERYSDDNICTFRPY